MFVRVCTCVRSDHLTLCIKGLTWVAVGGGGSVRIDGWVSILLYRFSIACIACELYLGNLTKVRYGRVFKEPLFVL